MNDAAVLYGMRPRDYMKAVQLFKEIREVDADLKTPTSLSATHNLGLMYLHGHGVAKDFAQARKLWEQAHALGHAGSTYCLGLMYSRGVGVAESQSKAVELWQQAHEKGNLDSTFNLANHYERGDGVARDTAKSIELYHQAHMAGMFEASYNLAVRYKRGDFVEKDEAMAFDLFQQAHSAGCNRSPLELGTMYMLGEGVERNKPKAFELWQCALANGLEPLYMCQCISNTMVAAARLDAAQSSSSSSHAQALPEKANRVVLGDKVILDGLEKAPELNGRSAVVRHLVMEGKPGRVGVEILPVPLVGEYCPLVGKQVAVRVEKIKLFPDYRPNPQNLAAWLARQRIRFSA